MQDHELEIIKQLMDQLSGQMKYTPDDLESRLGRKKPEGVMIVKVEGKDGMKDPMMGEKMGMDPDQAEDDMEEASEHDDMPMGMDDDEEMSPANALKQRIMKLRG